jgi:two-component system, cell cycle sensor histidine kinase and response regulator CckA
MGLCGIKTILVVDDEPAVLIMCQTILEMGGYNVLSAFDGQDALRLLQDSAISVDLALLDVMIPGMNGLELARRIRSENPGIKIILMSGYAPEEIASVVGKNPYGIIWKPFKMESLLRMIENA